MSFRLTHKTVSQSVSQTNRVTHKVRAFCADGVSFLCVSLAKNNNAIYITYLQLTKSDEIAIFIQVPTALSLPD